VTTHNVRDDQLPRGAGTGPSDAPITPSASVIVLRGAPFEVLLMRRAEKSTFVPGAWVFPGGIVEAEDRGADEQATARACAVRELAEEAGVRVDKAALVWTARWITPAGVPKRFDTWFFLAELPSGQTPAVDDKEGVELRWLTPAEALEGHRRGELVMVFPTLKTLESLVPFRSIPELLAARRNAEIPTTRPVIVIENGQKKVVLPD
jgi:8-oxo-dGTP pyrophosphatase MutT (NUDIX family)